MENNVVENAAASPRRYFKSSDYRGKVLADSGYTLGELSGLAVTGALAATGAFVLARYHVANPAQFIVRTGLGITNVSISKKAVQWPLQKVALLSMQPKNYTFSLQAMSKEKMEFVLPGVFTVGPADDADSLRKYATLLTSNDDAVPKDAEDRVRMESLDNAHLSSLIKGVVEGETRVLAAALEIEEIFDSRDKFRQRIIDTVQQELSKFGLLIYNANIKELEDAQGSEYFIHARQRKRADAENTARKDIADAKFRGDVAVKSKDTETRVQVSKRRGGRAQLTTHMANTNTFAARPIRGDCCSQ
jgi:flotillin